MAYTPTVWKDGQAPALDAEHLNKMEEGIAGADTMASQALEAAGKAGMRAEIVYDNKGGSVKECDISQYKDTAKFFAVWIQSGISDRQCVIVPNVLFKPTEWIYEGRPVVVPYMYSPTNPINYIAARLTFNFADNKLKIVGCQPMGQTVSVDPGVLLSVIAYI